MQKLAGDKFEIHSAWVLSDEFDHSISDVIKEIGIDVFQNKAINFSKLNEGDDFFDCAIMLCEDSKIDQCPVILRAKKRIYWEIECPLSNTPEDKKQKIRRIRDTIKSRIEHWLFVQSVEEFTA